MNGMCPRYNVWQPTLVGHVIVLVHWLVVPVRENR
jgi:hypothetical protein